ncbi:MAG: DUF3808 domain-containing protein [Acidobacteria bacterium]|nr:DUF3808 domain-containing protein [Acidobacteriota bacterium]
MIKRIVLTLTLIAACQLTAFSQSSASRQNRTAEEHYAAGLKFEGTWRVEEAEAEFRQAVQAAPTNDLYLFKLGSMLFSGGQLEEAVAVFRRAVELKPDNALYHYELAVTYNNLRRYAEAATELRQAVLIEPKNHGYRTLLDFAYGMAGKDDEETEVALREAVSYFPDDKYFRDSLGRLLLRHAKYPEAEDIFTKAVLLEPEEALNHFYLAEALSRQERFTEAEAEYTAAIKLYPRSPAFYRALLDLLTRQRKTEQIKLLSEQAAQNGIQL